MHPKTSCSPFVATDLGCDDSPPYHGRAFGANLRFSSAGRLAGARALYCIHHQQRSITCVALYRRLALRSPPTAGCRHHCHESSSWSCTCTATLTVPQCATFAASAITKLSVNRSAGVEADKLACNSMRKLEMAAEKRSRCRQPPRVSLREGASSQMAIESAFPYTHSALLKAVSRRVVQAMTRR